LVNRIKGLAFANKNGSNNLEGVAQMLNPYKSMLVYVAAIFYL